MEKIKSITTAKKLFEAGAKIRIVPNKINPNNIWGLCADIKRLETSSIISMDDVRYCNDFDFIIDNYSYYNCNYENGNYLHFYLLDDN